MKNKELKRSNRNKIIFGVIGGISEYFRIDPVLARLIFVVLLVVTGFFPLGIIYLIAVVVMPEDHRKDDQKVKSEVKQKVEAEVKE